MPHGISRTTLLALPVLIVWLAGCHTQPASPTPVPSTRAASATVQITATPSPLPTATATITPTGEAQITVFSPENIIRFITTTVQPRRYDTYDSPDGRWRVTVDIYDCTPIGDESVGGPVEHSYEQLTLIDHTGDSEHLIASQFLYCGGLGAGGLTGLFWADNSRYFYFTAARAGVPDGCGYWARPIQRLDLATLDVENLGGGPRDPTGTRYATWQGEDIRVWDIHQGDIARWATGVPETQRGPIAWSPDGESLIYLQLELGCPFGGYSYLTYLDLNTGEQRLLLQSEAPTFGAVAWESPDQLTLSDEHSTQWRYTLSTGDLAPIP